MNHTYKGFRANILPEFEPEESRIARGDWRCLIVGYRYSVRYKGKIIALVDDYPLAPTEEDAIADFLHRVDVMIDSSSIPETEEQRKQNRQHHYMDYLNSSGGEIERKQLFTDDRSATL